MHFGLDKCNSNRLKTATPKKCGKLDFFFLNWQYLKCTVVVIPPISVIGKKAYFFPPSPLNKWAFFIWVIVYNYGNIFNSANCGTGTCTQQMVHLTLLLVRSGHHSTLATLPWAKRVLKRSSKIAQSVDGRKEGFNGLSVIVCPSFQSPKIHRRGQFCAVKARLHNLNKAKSHTIYTNLLAQFKKCLNNFVESQSLNGSLTAKYKVSLLEPHPKMNFFFSQSSPFKLYSGQQNEDVKRGRFKASPIFPQKWFSSQAFFLLKEDEFVFLLLFCIFFSNKNKIFPNKADTKETEICYLNTCFVKWTWAT